MWSGLSAGFDWKGYLILLSWSYLTQVVAITVFLLLAIAFYVFLAPFLWFHTLEFLALALYSPLVCNLSWSVTAVFLTSGCVCTISDGCCVFRRFHFSKFYRTKYLLMGLLSPGFCSFPSLRSFFCHRSSRSRCICPSTSVKAYGKSLFLRSLCGHDPCGNHAASIPRVTKPFKELISGSLWLSVQGISFWAIASRMAETEKSDFTYGYLWASMLVGCERW